MDLNRRKLNNIGREADDAFDIRSDLRWLNISPPPILIFVRKKKICTALSTCDNLRRSTMRRIFFFYEKKVIERIIDNNI